MYQPEFCAVWLDRLTSKSNGHGLLFSVQFRVWAGVCSDARDCQEFCAVGHDDEKERIITWLSRKNFWTSSWL
ncbi:hypothetical protein CN155_30815, partial [Sinorhizobium meliloti]|uniref:hypothetical protein n=1 Tax=Rhizobium meliloti TaxID=382 RepID=UPI000FD85592